MTWSVNFYYRNVASMVSSYGYYCYVITVLTNFRHSQYRSRHFQSLLSCHTIFCGKSAESKQIVRSDHTSGVSVLKVYQPWSQQNDINCVLLPMTAQLGNVDRQAVLLSDESQCGHFWLGQYCCLSLENVNNIKLAKFD